MAANQNQTGYSDATHTLHTAAVVEHLTAPSGLTHQVASQMTTGELLAAKAELEADLNRQPRS